MHLYSQLIQAETGDVIKQGVRCNQVVTLRGYPETLSLHRRKLMQHPCGNEIQGDRKEQVGSA
jgi:hypothetical protein